MRKASFFSIARCCRLLRSRALCLVCFAVIGLPVVLTADGVPTSDSVPFRLRDSYLMIVQATVNGIGPFNFLLDTGTTRTVIDPALARQLQAPVIGEASLTGILHVRQDKLVRLKEIRLGQVWRTDLGAVVDELARQKTLAPGIRGVVGEDFLSQFDILIDYDRHWLRFGAAAPAGERCRFESVGQYHDSPTTNRLLIGVRFMEVSDQKVQLELDTGARTLEIFPARHDALFSRPFGNSMAATGEIDGTTMYSHITLEIGTTKVRGLDVVQSHRAIAFDAAGLLPASLFHRIYISHSGGFVVLNPSE